MFQVVSSANVRCPRTTLKQQQQQSPQLHSPHQPQTASSQLHQQGSQPGATTNQEVRNSIKEVTSAIVHYVQSGQEVVGGGGGRLSPRPDNWDGERAGARSTSPRGSRLVWMESSFVGVRPAESPDSPALPQSTSSTTTIQPTSQVQQQRSSFSYVPASPSRSSVHDVTLTTTTATSLTLTSFRSGAATGGETSEEGGSTPGVCYPFDDAGSGSFLSLSGGSTTDVYQQQQNSSLFLELAQSPRAEETATNILPHDHRHRQRRHRRPTGGGGSDQESRRESPSPTLQQDKQHHQSRHRHRQPEPTEDQQHRQQPQQQHQRGSSQSEDSMTCISSSEEVAAVTAAATTLLWNKPSPGSTTLEDVLDSLLGLPPASRTPSPGPGAQPAAASRH